MDDPTFQTFGRLWVLHPAGKKNRTTLWLCLCDCGKKTVLPVDRLRNGRTRSCGCLAIETRRANMMKLNKAGLRKEKASLTHGRSASRTYNSWMAMSQRCTNPKNREWNNYGGRGITVCKRWRQFANFLADMGERPIWATGGLDRKDPNGNYEPSNCRWATIQQQQETRRSSLTKAAQ